MEYPVCILFDCAELQFPLQFQVKRVGSHGMYTDLVGKGKNKKKSGKTGDSGTDPTTGKKLKRFNSWSMGSQDSLCSNSSEDSHVSMESHISTDSQSRFKGLWKRNQVKTIDLNGKDNPDLQDNPKSPRNGVTKSLEERLKSMSLPSSIASALLSRRASSDYLPNGQGESNGQKSNKKSPSSGSFKLKMFGARYKSAEECAKLGSHNQENVQISGWLQHKQLLKWSKLWCLVSRGYFYGYKSEGLGETPEFALPLRECSVHFVEGDKPRKHCFKLCHLNARSTYLAAPSSEDFNHWIQTLKCETKAWEEGHALLKPQAGIDSLVRQSLDSRASLDTQASVDSLQSSSASSSLVNSMSQQHPLKAQDSGNIPMLHGKSPVNYERTGSVQSDRNNNESSTSFTSEHTPESSPEYPGPVARDYGSVLHSGISVEDENDGFQLVNNDQKKRSLKWQPPCPAHGLDNSGNVGHMSGNNHY